MKKVIFLDRDGVINQDYGYVYKIEDFKFIDGVFEACRSFKKLGYEIVVVTNQSGIARGYYSEEEFLKLTSYMQNEFLKNGISILKTYYCPHLPNSNCECRKPKTGMILKALDEFDISLEKSWLIGDKLSDIECAKNANIKNRVLIDTKYEKNSDFFVAKNLFDSLKYINN